VGSITTSAPNRDLPGASAGNAVRSAGALALAPLRGLRFALRSLAARSRFLARSYYLLGSAAFGREQLAVIRGMNRYRALLACPEPGMALLRRNIHRLEKGLTMVPRKDLFALEYINETVTCFAKYVARIEADCWASDSELQWAHDVLCTYFKVTRFDPATQLARDRFDRAICGLQPAFRGLIPRPRSDYPDAGISYDSFLKLAQRRRSVRWFQSRAVDHDLLDKAVFAAGLSPSACNRQPFCFRILDQPALRGMAAKLPAGTAGYDQNIPVFIVLVGQLRNYASEADRHLIYIDASLAAMSFAFAAETLGLGTCLINWPDHEDREQQMADLLRLEADERPIMCIAVGYPDTAGLIACSQKKGLDQLRRYN
jgi:nitroreductase